MGTISVICASQPMPNPGMSTVDLAFRALAGRAGVSDRVRYWLVHMPEEIQHARNARERQLLNDRQESAIEYHCLRDRWDEVLDSDVLVYWGDFLHMAHYHLEVARRQVNLRLARSLSEGLEQARRWLILDGAPKHVSERTVSFGGNLLFNTRADYRDAYGPTLDRFLREARAVWMRDAFSAERAARARRSRVETCLGFDCSLLLGPHDLDHLPRRTTGNLKAQGAVGVWIGRTNGRERAIATFAADLARRLDSAAVWLPWRAISKRVGWQRTLWRMAGVNIRNIDELQTPFLGDILGLLPTFRAVVTDTYHVAVNAWRVGTPAICVADVAPLRMWDVSAGPLFGWRDKRWVFFAMNDALDFFVHLQELRHQSWRMRRLEHVCDLINSPDVVGDVRNEVLRSVPLVEAQLLAALGLRNATTAGAGSAGFRRGVVT